MGNGLNACVFGAARPWNRSAAAHLLRRAGFSPSETELRAALADGPTATIERLLAGAVESQHYLDLDQTGAALAARENIELLRGWWLLRMVHTQRPLHARLALFWHNHFATSYAKVRSAAMMLQQLRTFERLALGSFESLLSSLSRDPAMIVWLDGEQNVRGRPNENYARELFELFSLGVGNYSESDVKEAARAFTGWHQRRGQFYFVQRDHDTGEKTVLGTRGNLDGDDVVRLAVAQPACAAFLANRLLREFVCPQPPAELVESFAGVLRSTRYELRESLRTLLASEAMFDPRWRRARIKSPVEFVIGVVRSLELRVGAAPLSDAVVQMGQALFEPPSVKGWDGHRTWLNSATMLVRLNAVVRALDGTAFDPANWRSRHDLNDRDALIRCCAELTLDGMIPPGVDSSAPTPDADLNVEARRLLRALMSAPEYQMA